MAIHYLRSCEPPPGQCPQEDRTGVVIEGLSLGLNLRPHTVQETVDATVARLQAHEPVITAVSPQYDATADPPMTATVQDWEDKIYTLIEQIEAADPTDVPTYWGGIMLDEEQSFWRRSADMSANVADLQAITQYTAGVMAAQPCCGPWVYSEIFGNQLDLAHPEACSWTQDQFRSIIGAAIPAPQVATPCMVKQTNTYGDAIGAHVFITWSLVPPYNWKSFYLTEFQIHGPPYSKWGLNLSNCFAGAAACNDWDGDGLPNATDADRDNDACPNSFEPLQKRPLDSWNPWDFLSVPIPALFAAPDPKGLAAANVVGAAASQAIFGYYKAGAKAGATVYEQDLNLNGIPDGWEYDRSVIAPLHTGPPTGTVSAGAAQASFGQYKAHFQCR